MTKINKLDILSKNKFLSLYNANYTNKGGKENNWTIASRKDEETLKEIYFEGVESKEDAVVIVPFHKESNKLVIIKQFRVPVNGYVYELPAGLIDAGEDPKVSVVRELKEETGLKVVEIKENKMKRKLYLSPGMTDESVTLVYCTCEGDLSKEYLEEDEDIEAVLVSREEAEELLKSNVEFDIKCYLVLQEFVRYGSEVFE